MEKSVEIQFDLEQKILQCWNMVNDVEEISAHILDSPQFEGMDPKHADEIFNLLFGLAKVYELKFNNTWLTFEKLCSARRDERLGK